MAKSKTVVADPITSIQGSVKVTARKGSKKVYTKTVHNTAVANMLIGIARFLRGDFVNFGEDSSSFIPAYLAVGYITDETKRLTPFRQSSLYGELTTYSNRFDVTKGDVAADTANAQVTVKLNAVIPSGSIPRNTEINELGLFAKRSVNSAGMLARMVYTKDVSGTTRLATSVTDPNYENHIRIQSGYSYDIEWTIILSNK